MSVHRCTINDQSSTQVSVQPTDANPSAGSGRALGHRHRSSINYHHRNAQRPLHSHSRHCPRGGIPSICLSAGAGARACRLGAKRRRWRGDSCRRAEAGAARVCRTIAQRRAARSGDRRHRSSRGCARRLHRFHHSRERAPRPTDRPHLARSSGLRRVSAGIVRPRRPAFSLPVHQLHQLRAALHRHPRAPL